MTAAKMTNPPLQEKFIALFQQHELNTLMSNVYARADVLPIGALHIPVTIVDKVHDNCYVVSPYAGIVAYGHDETAKLPSYLRFPLNLGLQMLGIYLRFAKIDKIATLNNYCLSTNTFSSQVLDIEVAALTASASERYPDYALMLRSLNNKHHQDLLMKLHQHGWQLITSRQVYLFDEIHHSLIHQNTQRDFKLLDDGQFHFRICHSDDDYIQAQKWYNCLYLEKYSCQNVQFTPCALKAMQELGILELYLLENLHGQSMGVLGVVYDDGVMTAPIVGYDLTCPQSWGLYRRIIAKAMLLAVKHQYKLHLSSGAPSFKRLRGGFPCIEYSAVYTRHLPSARQKNVWDRLHQISPYYTKLLQHYQL